MFPQYPTYDDDRPAGTTSQLVNTEGQIVLIVGGTGYLGSMIARRLLEQGASSGCTGATLKSGMTWTILAPNIYMVVDRPAQDGAVVTLVGEGQHKHSMVAAQDVAAFAIAAVKNPTAENQRLVIGGPAPISWRDAVNACARVLGREVRVQFVSPNELIPALPDSLPRLCRSSRHTIRQFRWRSSPRRTTCG